MRILIIASAVAVGLLAGSTHAEAAPDVRILKVRHSAKGAVIPAVSYKFRSTSADSKDAEIIADQLSRAGIKRGLDIRVRRVFWGAYNTFKVTASESNRRAVGNDLVAFTNDARKILNNE